MGNLKHGAKQIWYTEKHIKDKVSSQGSISQNIQVAMEFKTLLPEAETLQNNCSKN